MRCLASIIIHQSSISLRTLQAYTSENLCNLNGYQLPIYDVTLRKKEINHLYRLLHHHLCKIHSFIYLFLRFVQFDKKEKKRGHIGKYTCQKTFTHLPIYARTHTCIHTLTHSHKRATHARACWY